MPRIVKGCKGFSYTNANVESKRFENKNFNSTSSYHSNFHGSIFVNTSFKNARFKFCNFSEASFDRCLLSGVKVKKGSLTGATFNNCIMIGCAIDTMKTYGCSFDSCYIINCSLGKNKEFINFINCEVLRNFPPEDDFPKEIIESIKQLKENHYIHKSKVLHRKRGNINTAAAAMLLRDYSVDFLIENIPHLGAEVRKDFHTLSYLTNILDKKAEA